MERARNNRLAPLMVGVLLVALAGALGGYLMLSAPVPAPMPPVPAAPRVMPVLEARPVPELQGNTLLPSSDLAHGTSRCVELGGTLRVHPDELSEAAGPAVVLSQPALLPPEGLGASGDAITCDLRFAVDPAGVPASLGIGMEGCPLTLQERICDSADAWRFAPPETAQRAGGFVALSRVTIRLD